MKRKVTIESPYGSNPFIFSTQVLLVVALSGGESEREQLLSLGFAALMRGEIW